MDRWTGLKISGRPSSPAADLGLFMRPGFWGGPACAKVRSAMDIARASPAEISTETCCIDEEVRRTLEVEVDPQTIREVQRELVAIRPEVSRFFRIPLTGAEGPGFLRYPRGGFYRMHVDRLEEMSDDFPRRISIVLFLTSAGRDSSQARCEGGSLRVQTGVDGRGRVHVHEIAPVEGLLVAFPSTLRHEVLPVTGGIRDVIVDWFY